MGFPCNQFGKQEPKSNAEILEFATSTYGATFPMFAKIEVNGPGASPVYAFLRRETGDKKLEWNFEKFLVGRDGHVLERFATKVTPAQIEPRIVDALASR